MCRCHCMLWLPVPASSAHPTSATLAQQHLSDCEAAWEQRLGHPWQRYHRRPHYCGHRQRPVCVSGVVFWVPSVKWGMRCCRCPALQLSMLRSAASTPNPHARQPISIPKHWTCPNTGPAPSLGVQIWQRILQLDGYPSPPGRPDGPQERGCVGAPAHPAAPSTTGIAAPAPQRLTQSNNK